MKKDTHKRVRESLAKDHSCYVLITCTEPSDDGNMEVEMTYEGDSNLAAYLVEGAQSVIDQDLEQSQCRVIQS